MDACTSEVNNVGRHIIEQAHKLVQIWELLKLELTCKITDSDSNQTEKYKPRRQPS